MPSLESTRRWLLHGNNAQAIHRDIADSAMELAGLWDEIILSVVNGETKRAITLLVEAQAETAFIAEITSLLAQKRADEALAIIQEAKGA